MRPADRGRRYRAFEIGRWLRSAQGRMTQTPFSIEHSLPSGSASTSIISAGSLGQGPKKQPIMVIIGTMPAGSPLISAIAFMAIALDRLSQAFAERNTTVRSAGARRRHRALWAALAAIVAVGLLAQLWPALQHFPAEWQVTFSGWTDRQISALNKAWFDELEAVKKYY